MSTTAQEILNLFDSLSSEDKHAVVVEILRRLPEGDLPEPVLDALAGELFANLDAEEAARAQP